MYREKGASEQNPFNGKQFQGDIILWSVSWYCCYALMAGERGLSIERSMICRWVQEYAPQLATSIKSAAKQTQDSWQVDDTYLKIKGRWHYLYCVIDLAGNTLDWILSTQRNKKAAKRFFKKTLKNN